MKITIRLRADKGFRFLKEKYLPKAPSYNLDNCEGEGFRRFKKESCYGTVDYFAKDTYLCESARDYNSKITRDEYSSFCKILCKEYINRLKELKGVDIYIYITDEYF